MKIINQFLQEKTFYVSQNDLKNVNKDLVQYITKKIYPLYNKFDSGHDIRHVLRVTKYSLHLANFFDVNINMVYCIAAYHDVGFIKEREIHHEISKQIVLNDKNLKKWFDKNQIQIIADAVFDHRASSKKPPRSIYGKIVADADKSYIKLEYIIEKAIAYITNKGFSKQEIYDGVYEHIKEKFGRGGYAKFWLPQTKKMLESDIRRNHQIISNEKQFKKIYEKVFSQQFK